MTARAVAPALLLALTGCGLPANVVILLPDENGKVGKVAVHEGGSTAELLKPLAAVNAGSEASLRNVFTAQQSDVDSEFTGALEATPREPVVYILYFQTGSTELDARSRGDLAAAIAEAKGTSNVDISVVGHADATGADPYNLALSLRRAETVRDALVAAGISSEIIEIAYHGANNPLIPTPPRGPGAAQQARRGDHPLKGHRSRHFRPSRSSTPATLFVAGYTVSLNQNVAQFRQCAIGLAPTIEPCAEC